MEGGVEARLAAAFASMGNPALDARNPHFGSRFASLAAVLGVVRPALAAQGLRLSQTVEDGRMLTRVHGPGGESAELCALPCALGGTPQQVGSAVTYFRRYSLLMAFGLVGEPDDDGEAATAAPAMPAAYDGEAPF